MQTFTEAIRGEIRAELARRSIPQTILAEAWGVTQSSVSTKLSGGSALSTKQAEQAAEALGYDAFEFIARAGQNATAAA